MLFTLEVVNLGAKTCNIVKFELPFRLKARTSVFLSLRLRLALALFLFVLVKTVLVSFKFFIWGPTNLDSGELEGPIAFDSFS